MTSTGRVARLTALALATGTLVAAGSTSAVAATPIADKLALAANTSGNVLRIEVNLPTTLPAVPGLGHSFVQTISLSDGEIANGTALKGLSHAALGQGALTDLVRPTALSALFPEATSTLASPSSVKKGIDLSNPSAGLTLKVLDTTSMVADADKVTNGLLSESHTALDQIRISAPKLALQLPVALSDVTDLVESVVGTVQAPAGEVTASVDSAIGVLNRAAGQNVVSDSTASAAVDTLTQTLTGLQNLAAGVAAADDSLVSIKQLTSDQNVVRTGGLVSASSTNALTNISLLGGLVTVDALKSGVTSSVDTVAKKANVTYLPESDQIVRVRIAGVLDLVLDATGIRLDGLPTALPVGTVTNAVNAAVAQILAATKLLGIQVASGKNAVPTIAADGSGASGSASGAGITINPLGAAKPLLALSFVNSAAGVSAQRIVLPTKKTSSRSADTITVKSESLPRTGANLGLTGVAAAGLIGLAMVARRRRMAHIAE